MQPSLDEMKRPEMQPSLDEMKRSVACVVDPDQDPVKSALLLENLKP
jgi:hypothetical protein